MAITSSKYLKKKIDLVGEATPNWGISIEQKKYIFILFYFIFIFEILNNVLLFLNE
jgi:hypothetical protein